MFTLFTLFNAQANILMDLFLAGGETSSTTLAWSVLHMVRHPDIQVTILINTRTEMHTNKNTNTYFGLVLFPSHDMPSRNPGLCKSMRPY